MVDTNYQDMVYTFFKEEVSHALERCRWSGSGKRGKNLIKVYYLAAQLETVRALKLYQSLGLWKVPLESVNTVGN